MNSRWLGSALAVLVSVAVAAPHSGGAARHAPPVQAETVDWHARHLTSKELDDALLGEPGEPRFRELSVDALLDGAGRTVGYNSISSRVDPDTGLYVSRLGIALKRGALVAKIKQDRGVSGDRYITIRGPIKGGVGRFADVRGRVLVTIDTEFPQGEGTAEVRIRWRR